jgi:hypothetical protein
VAGEDDKKIARNALWHFLQFPKMCVPDESGDFILLCMKIMIFTKITLLFPKIKFSSRAGKARPAVGTIFCLQTIVCYASINFEKLIDLSATLKLLEYTVF